MPIIRNMDRAKNRLPITLLFILYMAALLYFLFFSENYGHGGSGEYSSNFYPFKEIIRYIRYQNLLGARAVFLNLAGNVIGFLPFGALLPVLQKHMRRLWRTLLLGFALSALVEVIQLIFRIGCFDVDDIILNTFGSLLGYLLFLLGSRLYGKLEAKRG